MREWRETHHQLLIVCKELNLQRNIEPAKYETIHRALLTGFLFPNVFLSTPLSANAVVSLEFSGFDTSIFKPLKYCPFGCSN